MKFLSDECTSEEVEEIIHYLKTAPQVGDLPEVEEVRAKLGPLPKLDADRADLIFDNIINTDRAGKSVDLAGRTRGHWWKVAAAVTGLLLVSSLFFYWQRQPLTYTTSFGETQTIRLSDGTKVILNANSELSLPRHWEQAAAREVWLEGEAFFSVVHTADHREFRVRTYHDLSVEVLGTKFNVNSRKDKATVVLNSGKVKVQAREKGVDNQWVMQPGDLIAYEPETQQVQQKMVDTTLYTSWRNNLLLFKDTPLKEVATIIREHHGYEVSFAQDSLTRLRFTGSNPADDLDLLLETLELSFNIQITKENKQIHIRGTK